MSDTQNIPGMISPTLIVSGKSIEVPCGVKCEAYTVIVNTEAKVADTHITLTFRDKGLLHISMELSRPSTLQAENSKQGKPKTIEKLSLCWHSHT